MNKNGPVVIVDDDPDDHQILAEVFSDLQIKNELKFFFSCVDAYQYLSTTDDIPFLIISDVNLPAMTGNELKKKINDNPVLRRKSIPFIFLTTSGNQTAIQEAYELMVQGYFIKPSRLQDIEELVRMIVTYWKSCKDPNN